MRLREICKTVPRYLKLSRYSSNETTVARPKSDDKRNAILSAATQIFAERGLSAPTSAISNLAGVAEGTLFTYFKNKEELLNELYREIKLDLADAMMSDFPRKKSVRARLRHIWDCYTSWGVSHSDQRKVLSQLQLSGSLTTESKKAGSAPFAEIKAMSQEAVGQRILQNIPQDFFSANMDASAQTTVAFMAAHPASAEKYQALGFDIFWRGISKK
jgi:AcrR family transcriptional regulator